MTTANASRHWTINPRARRRSNGERDKALASVGERGGALASVTQISAMDSAGVALDAPFGK